MKTITQEQARELVKNTKGYFRTILVSKFGFDLITTEKPIEVSDEFYEQMKKCFKEKQSDVFDKIFGKDEEGFKEGDWVYVLNSIKPYYKQEADVFKVVRVKTEPSNDVLAFFDKRCGVSTDRLRKATPEEIKAHLIEECKKRGIWDVPVNCLYYENNFYSVGLYKGCVTARYYKPNDRLWSKYGLVYENGKFTTPLEEEKQYPPEGTVCFVWDKGKEKDYWGFISISLGNGKFSKYPLDPSSSGASYNNFEIYEPKKHFKSRK